MKNFNVSEFWSSFESTHQEILDLLRLAGCQVREGREKFQHEASGLEELFVRFNGSLAEFAWYFEHERSYINTVWALEEALEGLFVVHSQLKDLSVGSHVGVWEFLEDMEEHLDFSMNLFDNSFVMTRIPLAFVDQEALQLAAIMPPPAKEVEAGTLLQKELNALISYRPETERENAQEEHLVLKGKLRRKLVGRQLNLLKELKEVEKKCFWDKRLLEFCTEQACVSGSFEVSQFLNSLYFFVEFGHLTPQRSAAFRLCFFHLMQFHLEASYQKYDKRSKYQFLQVICQIKPEDLEELELSLPDLRRLLVWISAETCGLLKTDDFDPAHFLRFLKRTEPAGLKLTNPGRIGLFYKVNLMNAPLYASLKFKKGQKAALQVFTGTSFKSITRTLKEIEGMRHWPNEEEIDQLIASFSETA